MANKRQLEAIPVEETTNLHSHQEFNEGVFLLNQEIILQTPEGPKKAKILEIEPFICMEKASHKKAYESKSRKRGEMFIIWFRGTIPFLNVVVNPQQGSIVSIKKVLIDGKTVSGLTLINMLGMARNTVATKGPDGTRKWRKNVEDKVDGIQVYDEDSIIKVESSKNTGSIIELRRVTGSRANNSLGIFVNTARFNQSINQTIA